MSNRALPILGVGALAGVGYYLYNAGGDPKAAEKKFEADVHKASAKVKSEMPNTNQVGARANEAEKRGEAFASQAASKVDAKAREAGAEFDKATAQGKAKLAQLEADAKAQANKAGAEINKAIDNFDAKVTEGASKAKTGISSWFGGK